MSNKEGDKYMKRLKRLLVLFVTVAMMMTMCLPMMAQAAAGNDGIVGTKKRCNYNSR